MSMKGVKSTNGNESEPVVKGSVDKLNGSESSHDASPISTLKSSGCEETSFAAFTTQVLLIFLFIWNLLNFCLSYNLFNLLVVRIE